MNQSLISHHSLVLTIKERRRINNPTKEGTQMIPTCQIPCEADPLTGKDVRNRVAPARTTHSIGQGGGVGLGGSSGGTGPKHLHRRGPDRDSREVRDV